MIKLEQIEKSVADLSPAERRKFIRWSAEFWEAEWDKRIEADVKAGKLDKMADAAIAAHRAGNTRPL